MRNKIICSLLVILSCVSSLAVDIDATFIDRTPNYAYDAPKNHPAPGDPVSFVGHMKVYDGGQTDVEYIWYLDGLEMGHGTVLLRPGEDNTVTLPWTWEERRHEIMLVLDPSNHISEESEYNNIVFDFTDGLIMGIAVESGLVDYFRTIQPQVGIGSMSFEDWVQRQARIWNLNLMERAGEMSSNNASSIQDRVRALISYHTDGTLAGGNCPLEWKQVDMIWGKLTSDIPGYENEKGLWFYEASLPHEMTHARGLPDLYIYDVGASMVEIVDDSGLPVVDTDYMPKFSWESSYLNKNGGMMGAGGSHYSLFDANLWDLIAGRRSPGCNGNGCCQHDFPWGEGTFPSRMYLRLLRMDGSAWVGARLDVYRRFGWYGEPRFDNIIDYSLFTDEAGRALLPTTVFDRDSGEFILKITAPGGAAREYRFVEQTDFHNAFWEGHEGDWEYKIRTDFAPVPTGESMILPGGFRRGALNTLRVKGTQFLDPPTIVFDQSGIVVERAACTGPNEASFDVRFPWDIRDYQVGYRIYNPDGKVFRIKDAYSQSVFADETQTGPTARFLVYDLQDSMPLTLYLNGLWSDDWTPQYWHFDHIASGIGPIASYQWDFGDGSSSNHPCLLHVFPAPGTYTVSLCVTDGDGNSHTATRDIVASPPCTLSCDAAATPSAGYAPLLVQFETTVHPEHCDGQPTVLWSFGDGASSTESSASHTYAEPGTYTWTLSSTVQRAQCAKTGTIWVLAQGELIPGDCGGDGSVSIGEVQKAINMFLGATQVDCGVDCDGSGAVSIGELQKVINAFLGLAANC